MARILLINIAADPQSETHASLQAIAVLALPSTYGGELWRAHGLTKDGILTKGKSRCIP